eukprot:2208311-Prorocentrum_lima.AAC.1
MPALAFQLPSWLCEAGAYQFAGVALVDKRPLSCDANAASPTTHGAPSAPQVPLIAHAHAFWLSLIHI